MAIDFSDAPKGFDYFFYIVHNKNIAYYTLRTFIHSIILEQGFFPNWKEHNSDDYKALYNDLHFSEIKNIKIKKNKDSYTFIIKHPIYRLPTIEGSFILRPEHKEYAINSKVTKDHALIYSPSGTSDYLSYVEYGYKFIQKIVFENKSIDIYLIMNNEYANYATKGKPTIENIYIWYINSAYLGKPSLRPIEETRTPIFAETPAVNEKGLTSTRTSIYYIPKVDKLDEFKSLIRERLVNDELPVDINNPVIDGVRIIYTDFSSNYAILAINDKLRTFLFNKHVPPAADRITEVLEYEFNPAIFPSKLLGKDVDIEITPADMGWFINKEVTNAEQLEVNGIKLKYTKYVEDIPNILKNYYKTVGGFEDKLEYGEPWTLGRFKSNSECPLFRKIRDKINEAAELAKQKLETAIFSTTDELLETLRRVAILVIAAEYTDTPVKRENTEGTIILNKTFSPDAPLIKEGFNLMPHQSGVLYVLDRAPKAAVLNIAAGGGKTLIGLLDALSLLKKGIIHRPLILCPDFLTKNYVEDAYKATEGRVNIFVLTTDTFNQMKKEAEEQNIDAYQYVYNKIVDLPPNSVVISSYEWASGVYVKGEDKTVNYSLGFSDLEINKNTYFLKTIGFDYIVLDESHRMRNIKSDIFGQIYQLVKGIKYRRLATGTFVYHNLKNIFGQAKMLDPSIFGDDINQFIEEFSDRLGRGNNLVWRPDAEHKILGKISSRYPFFSIRKKHWAWLLPDKVERFHVVELNKIQNKIYDALLEQTLEVLKRDKELMEYLNSSPEEQEENSAKMEMLIYTHFARLEQFVTAPVAEEITDEIKKFNISPEELKSVLISPKVNKTIEIIQEHLSKDEGKILVFTHYLESAKAVYDALPPELKDVAIHYLASKKKKLIAQFKNNPKYKILIGVEDSLSEGVNLQFCSRIIRLEMVWSPGALEQAESRIFRPDPSNTYKKRKEIYIDTIVCDKTIDVLKLSRLMQLIISSYKVYELGNDLYKEILISNLPPISLGMDNLKKRHEVSLYRDYFDLYNKLRNIEKIELDEARKLYKDYDFVPVKPGVPLKGTKYVEVPYVDDGTVPFMDQLGLVKLNEYLEELGIKKSIDLKGHNIKVHTRYGDGVLVGLTANKANVLINGEKVSVSRLQTFAITQDWGYPTKSLIKGLIEGKIEIADNKIVKKGESEIPVKPAKPDTPEQRIQETKPVIKPKPAVTPEKPKPAVTPEQRIQETKPAVTPEQRIKPAIETKPTDTPEPVKPKSIDTPEDRLGVNPEDLPTGEGWTELNIDENQDIKTLEELKKELDQRLQNLYQKINVLLERKQQKPDMGFYVMPVIVNGVFALFVERSDTDAIPFIKRFGFRLTGPYIWIKITNISLWDKILDGIKDYILPERYKKLENLTKSIRTGRFFASSIDDAGIRNFYEITRFRQNIISPYPIVWNKMDDKPSLYLYIPKNKNPNMQKVMNLAAWKKSSGDYVILFNTKQEAIRTLKRMGQLSKELRIQIFNLDDAIETFKRIPVKEDDEK